MSAPLRFAIRADQSSLIGTGHVKRCQSLAEALSRAGREVMLVTRRLDVKMPNPSNASPTINVRWLPSPSQPVTDADGSNDAPHANWAEVSWQQDVAETCAALREFRPDWVIVDHYSFDRQWHAAVADKLNTKIAVIDDLATNDLAADLLIDHNLAANHFEKYAGKIPANCPILGGPRYALLSQAYATPTPFEVHDDVRSIGIFMGGVDAADMSSIAFKACRDVAGFNGPIEIVTTSANRNADRISTMISQDGAARLLVDLPDLAAFFSRHDIQIGAGGGAAWERCCMGAPTIVVSVAQNQQAVVPQLADRGIIATPEMATADGIGQLLTKLIADPSRRRNMSTLSQDLVDGRGAERVALCLSRDAMTLRPAKNSDAEMTYRWRNHPVTRAASLNPESIVYNDHVEWLKRSLENPLRFQLIASIGTIDVGVIRFDFLNTGEAEVSLYLDPTLHGLGLGRRLLSFGEKEALRQRRQLTGFVADILENNQLSCQTFRACQYAYTDSRWRKSVT